MGRAPCCDKANVKRGPWSPEEDATLKNYLHKHGTGGNWISLPQRAGLRRCGKSCRLRWLNYLRPDIKHGPFTEEEDNLIISMYYKLGSRWSVIAANLQGRTDNDVKNHWNTKLKKKLFGANNKKFNSTIPPKLHVPFTNNNVSIINPSFQSQPSSSTPTTPSISASYNVDNYNHPSYNDNGPFYVPLVPSFSDLLVQCTNNSSSMSLMPNYTNLSNLDYANYNHDPVVDGASSIQYPFHQALLMSQVNANTLVKAENVSIVHPHEEASSASGSSSAVCGGSSFEDDPFLAELGFGLLQEEVMTNPGACNYGADQEDIKPKGLGQSVIN